MFEYHTTRVVARSGDGAKLAEPSKLVVNVIGDTGFGQCGMDIETATREGLPILTIILNEPENGGL